MYTEPIPYAHTDNYYAHIISRHAAPQWYWPENNAHNSYMYTCRFTVVHLNSVALLVHLFFCQHENHQIYRPRHHSKMQIYHNNVQI